VSCLLCPFSVLVTIPSATALTAGGLSAADIKAGKTGGVAGLTQTPANVQSAMNALSGLYSNDTSKILSSIQLLGANVGYSRATPIST